jgi:hypothetical protein
MSWNIFFRKNYEKMTQLGIGLEDLNVIKIRAGEFFRHQLVKFIICHHLIELKHHFKTEQVVVGGICDIIDLDTFTIYEVESNPSPINTRKKLNDFDHPLIEDLLIVDLRKLKRWRNVFDLRREVAKLVGLR